MAFDPNRIPDALKTAYKGNQCAIFVGAGASMGARLPDWAGLLTQMLDQAVKHRVVHSDKEKEYRKLLGNPANFLMIASELKSDLKHYFDGFFEDTFIKSKPEPTALHTEITQAKGFQFALTTNYDTLLERAYRRAGYEDISVSTFLNSGDVQRRLVRREFFILKAHGDAQKVGDGIVLTEEDYREIIGKQRAYRSLLSTMFTMFNIVFVGASMVDPEIKLLLSYIADAYAPTTGPQHFALMAQEDTTTVETDHWLKDFKVQVVPVSKANGYAEVTEFIGALRSC
jgi:hypothetical protein